VSVTLAGNEQRQKMSDGVRELSLAEYLAVVRRRWKIIAALPVLLGVAGYLWSNRATRLYSAAAEVLVESQSATSLVDPTGLQFAADQQRQLENEVRFANSQAVYRALVEALDYAPTNVGASADAQSADVLVFVSTNADPQVAAEEANIYARTYLRARAQRVAQTYLEAAQGIDELVTKYKAERDTLNPESPADEARLEALNQNIRFYEGQRDALDLSAQVGRGSGATVISEAQVPGAPVSPRPLRTATLAVATGLILAIGIALAREFLDDRVRTADDVRRVTSSPMLGQLPRDDKHGRDNPIHENDRSGLTEAVRSLRTSVQFAALRSPLRAVQITSANPSEGKTTVAANLAVALARSGEHVVLIDADLRNPSLHTRFGLDNHVGLANVLLGQVDLDDALVAPSDEIPLQFLASGPQPGNPADFLWSATAPDDAVTLPKLLARLAAAGRQVVVDCPPVLPVADAMTISRMVDGTVFVVAADSTRSRDLDLALLQLDQAEANLIGVVFNRVSMGHGSYGYGYGYGYRYGPRPQGVWQRTLARLRLRRPERSNRRATIAVPSRGAAQPLPPIARPTSALARAQAEASDGPAESVGKTDVTATASNGVVDLAEAPAEVTSPGSKAAGAADFTREEIVLSGSAITTAGRANGRARGAETTPGLTNSVSAAAATELPSGEADIALIRKLRLHLGVEPGDDPSSS
jgi:capsular exopolysaccharide synthesis family protein